MSDGMVMLLGAISIWGGMAAIAGAFFTYAGLVKLFIWATEPRHQQLIDEFDLQIALAKVHRPAVPLPESMKEGV